MNNRIRGLEAKKCLNSQHDLFYASLICTYDNCDKANRYLCALCLNEKIHLHNQQDDKHIMDLKSLLTQILKILSDQQCYLKHFKYCFDHFFLKLDFNGDRRAIKKFKSEAFCVLDYINKNMSQLSLDFIICGKCFNFEEHDHKKFLLDFNEMKAQLSNSKYIQQYILKLKNIIRFLIDKEPIYNNQKISEIQEILLGKYDVINYEYVEHLVFIRNSGFNISSIYQAFKGSIKQFLMKLNIQNKGDLLQIDETLNLQQQLFENTKYISSVQDIQIKNKIYQRYRIVIVKFDQGIQYLFCGDEKGHLFCFKIKQYYKIFYRQFYKKQIKSILPINNQEVITVSNDGIVIITNYIYNKIITRISIMPSLLFCFHQNLCSAPCIEYDKKQGIIYLWNDYFQIIRRLKLQYYFCPCEHYKIEQLQLVQNNTHVLSKCLEGGLQLWKIQHNNLLLVQLYKSDISQFHLIIHNNKIILIGECQIELLRENLNLEKFLIFQYLKYLQPRQNQFSEIDYQPEIYHQLEIDYNHQLEIDYQPQIDFIAGIDYMPQQNFLAEIIEIDDQFNIDGNPEMYHPEPEIYHEPQIDYQIMLPLKEQIVQNFKLLIQSWYH